MYIIFVSVKIDLPNKPTQAHAHAHTHTHMKGSNSVSWLQDGGVILGV